MSGLREEREEGRKGGREGGRERSVNVCFDSRDGGREGGKEDVPGVIAFLHRHLRLLQACLHRRLPSAPPSLGQSPSLLILLLFSFDLMHDSGHGKSSKDAGERCARA